MRTPHFERTVWQADQQIFPSTFGTHTRGTLSPGFMPTLRGTITFVVVSVLIVWSVLVSDGQTPSAVLSFDGAAAGSHPASALVLGTDGNLYGTTLQGGSGTGLAGHGTVFRLTAAGAATTLYAFTGGSDGASPTALTQATDGNFYGATTTGGTGGYGTLFRLSPGGALTTLYTFTGKTDGATPNAPTAASDGNVYGTTRTGGSGYGTMFQLTTAGTLTTLHAFGGGTDGASPLAALVQGSDGNLYGTTGYGGSATGYDGSGTVFRATAAGAVTTLHAFNGAAEGSYPYAPLMQGTDGAFYGTTSGSASGSNYGTAFRVAADGTLTTLHAFTNAADGNGPAGGLAQDAAGTLYGTTHTGGLRTDSSFADGTLFSLTTAGALTTLSTFDGAVSGAGYNPEASLISGGNGLLYGVTPNGGTSDAGLVFTLTAASHPAFFTGEVSVGSGVYYLAFSTGNYFGYYSYLPDSHYIYHYDLGYEYVFDAADGKSGVYFYDFKSGGYFYTSPTFPFPYMYDFTLNSVVYYYPDPNNAGRYNTDGYRFFYVFSTGQTISK